MRGLERTSALVTGASRGIGLETARRLWLEGGRVAVVARDVDRLRTAVELIGDGAPDRVVGIAADCSRIDDLSRAYQQATDAIGPINALVNNAGHSAQGPFLDVTLDDWRDDLDLKLLASIHLSRLVITDLLDRGEGGRIVNVLSIAGKNPSAGSGPSSVSRAAGLALTKALSKEFAGARILVNAVCIGFVRSGQHEDRWRLRRPGSSFDEYLRDIAAARGVPLGRFGESSEAASVIAFLLSEEADFVTGTAINVDGGASPSV